MDFVCCVEVYVLRVPVKASGDAGHNLDFGELEGIMDRSVLVIMTAGFQKVVFVIEKAIDKKYKEQGVYPQKCWEG